MSGASEVSAVLEPFLAPGGSFRIPEAVRDLIVLRGPVTAPEPLTTYRRARPGRIAAEQQQRQRLDWQGHQPADEPLPATSGFTSAGSTSAGWAKPAVQPDTPTAQRIYDDDGFLNEEAMRAERVATSRFEDELLQRFIRREATSGTQWPGAAEYGTWSDERLELEQRLARLDDVDWPDEDPFADPDGQEESPEIHPLHGVMCRLRDAQRSLRIAESERVAMALRAWRAAAEFLTGTPSAALNGPFHRSVMMELANDLQLSERAAMSLVHTADDLDQRLPLCWERFIGGEVPWRAMQVLHAQADGLAEEFRARFDDEAAAKLASTPVPRLKTVLHDLRERIQARTAVDRHKNALQRMHVGIEPAADGMAYLTALLPAPEAVFIDQRLDLAARAAAAAEGEQRPIGQLRAHILMDVIDEGLFRGVGDDREGLADPERRGVQCKVALLIPAMTALGHSDVPAVLQGYGPIDIETAKRLAGAATSWIKVLTDPITGAVFDIGREKYRPTSDMRTLLGLLDRGGRGPGCTRPPQQTEMDHVTPFRQHLARGRTALDNLVLLARGHHAAKTSGLWDIRLQAMRVLAWTSFMGTRIITTVDPLPPTPVPPEFLAPSAPRPEPPAASWADPDEPDELDCPF